MTGSRKPTEARKRPSTRGVTFAAVCKIASGFPGVEEGLSWGTPGLKVKGRFLARLKEDGESLVLRIGLLEREGLMARAPHVFYITDHYLNYPAVLIRLPKVSRAVLARVLEDSWRQVAPDDLVARHDAVEGLPRRVRKPRRA
jgi:hypothetical protein